MGEMNEPMLECSPFEKHSVDSAFADIQAMIRHDFEAFEALEDARLRRLVGERLLALIGVFDYRLLALVLVSRGFGDQTTVETLAGLGFTRDKDSPQFAEVRINSLPATGLMKAQFDRSALIKARVVKKVAGVARSEWPSFPVLVTFDESECNERLDARVSLMTSKAHTAASAVLEIQETSINFARHNIYSWFSGHVDDVALATAMGHTVGGVSAIWRHSVVGIQHIEQMGDLIAKKMKELGIKAQASRSTLSQASRAVSLPKRIEGDGQRKPKRPTVVQLPSRGMSKRFDEAARIFRALERQLHLQLTPEASIGAAIFMTIMSGAARGELLQLMLGGFGADRFHGSTLDRCWVRLIDGQPQTVSVALSSTAGIYWARAILDQNSLVPRHGRTEEPLIGRDRPPFSVTKCLTAFCTEIGASRKFRLAELEEAATYQSFSHGLPPFLIAEASRLAFADASFGRQRPSSDVLLTDMRLRVASWWADRGRGNKLHDSAGTQQSAADVSAAKKLLSNYFDELLEVSDRNFRRPDQQADVARIRDRYTCLADERWRPSSAVHLAILWVAFRLVTGEHPSVSRVRKDVSSLFHFGLFGSVDWPDLLLASSEELEAIFEGAALRQSVPDEQDRVRGWAEQLCKIGLGEFFNEPFSLSSSGDAVLVMGSARCRVLTYTEFDALYAALSEFDSERALVVRVAIGLGYWAGMRPGEVVDLQIRDVQALRRSLMINVRGKKSSAARRRIPIHLLAPDLFLDDLRKLLRLRKEQAHPLGREAFGTANLFAVPGTNKGLSYPMLVSPIIQLLKDAFGQFVTFYHLRHAFVNYSLLRSEAAIDDEFRSSLPDRYHLMFSAYHLDRFMEATATSEYVVGAGAEQTTRLIGIAKVLGHAGMETMFRAYCHTLHLIAGYRIRKLEAQRVEGARVSRRGKQLLTGYSSSRTLAKIPSDRCELVDYLGTAIAARRGNAG